MAGAERQQRIALVGANGFAHASEAVKVECFPWDRLRRAKNLADYDVLIVDLLSLDDPSAIDAREFERLLDARTAGRILGEGEGAIYVLGDPRFEFVLGPEEDPSTEPFLFWTGLEFRWDDEEGEALERGPQGYGAFAPLAAGLGRYSYGLSDCETLLDDEEQLWGVWDLGAVSGPGLEASCEISDILTTRYGASVSFVVRHVIVPSRAAVRRHVGGKSYQPGAPGGVVAQSGPIVFLPAGRLSEAETVELILRDLYGVEISAAEPGWVEEFVAPGQREIDGAIASIDAEIAALSKRRERLLGEREAARHPLGLLYQTGAALEEAVWSAMESLGAEVERPEKGSNAADGRATVRLGDDTLEFVLEIKGEKNEHFGINSLRQLADWVSDAIDRGDEPPKALMVGNGSRTQHPRRRGWPFNPNFVSNARKRGHAAIRSEDLYVAYLLDRRGELDREGFWRELRETRGPVEIRPYREKLTAEEAAQLEAAEGR